MDENEFWNIIALFNCKYVGDDERVVKKVVNYYFKNL